LSASNKLGKQVRVELEQMKRLLQRHPGLIEKCRTEPPSHLEIDALATLLHSFYSGVENIFKRVSIAIDGGPPSGLFWHVALLESMARPTASRPAVISESLRQALKRYLDFRHVFRHAYAFELKWSKMSPLVLDVEDTLHALEDELARFLTAIGHAGEGMSTCLL